MYKYKILCTNDPWLTRMASPYSYLAICINADSFSKASGILLPNTISERNQKIINYYKQTLGYLYHHVYQHKYHFMKHQRKRIRIRNTRISLTEILYHSALIKCWVTHINQSTYQN